MLLKWLFTLLAIMWLYQAIKPFFVSKPLPPNPNKKSKIQRRDNDDDGDYIDYEEIK